MHSVLERILDPSTNVDGVTILEEFDQCSEKNVYGWHRNDETQFFDFLGTFGGLDPNGNPQVPFYPNLAM